MSSRFSLPVAGTAGLVASTIISLSIASAADIAPVLKAPPPASTNWTGFYLNGGGGYGFWTADTSTSRPNGGAAIPTLPATQRDGGRGWLGRVGGGFDYQFDPRIVAGVFADYDVSSLKGTIQDAVAGVTTDIKQTSSWAVGGRVGWLATPEILTYINAGFSSAHFSSGSMVCQLAISAPFCSGYTTPSFTANGWFLGGGVESSLGSGWFWRNVSLCVLWKQNHR
jgi:outer membrane immunogenic protein